MRNTTKIALILLVTILFACGGEKVPLPTVSEEDGLTAVDDTTYLRLSPVWGSETGYDFDHPQDILVGREPLLYVADTGNDRIVMMDLAGTILGFSQLVENPVAVTQDSKLNLLIVTDSNTIYRIKLVENNHDISNAPMELVYQEVDNPDRRYTGISAFLRVIGFRAEIRYYVAATGEQKRDNQVLVFPESFNIGVPDAVNLEPNGFGIQSASNPSGITTLNDFNEDFIFCMTGQNSFKVQWVTTGEFGFQPRLNPANGDFDLFDQEKFSMPEDVAVDEEGSIYVIDSDRFRLYKFSPSGDELQSFGVPDPAEGVVEFNQPQGVAVFNQTLYIADTGNNRIVRFKLSTDVSGN